MLKANMLKVNMLKANMLRANLLKANMLNANMLRANMLRANMLKVTEGNGKYVKDYRREQHICLSRQSNALSQNYNSLALSPEKRKRCTAFRYKCKIATLSRI